MKFHNNYKKRSEKNAPTAFAFFIADKKALFVYFVYMHNFN